MGNPESIQEDLHFEKLSFCANCKHAESHCTCDSANISVISEEDFKKQFGAEVFETAVAEAMQKPEPEQKRFFTQGPEAEDLKFDDGRPLNLDK